MQVHKLKTLFFYPVGIAYLIFIMALSLRAIAGNDSLKQIVNSIEGLTPLQKEQLTTALRHQFGDILDRERLKEEYTASLKNIISAGIFEGVSYESIADAAYKVYLSERNGAPAEYVEDLAVIDFARPITQSQLEMAAKALSQLIASDISSNVSEELISYGLYNDWTGEAIARVSEGLIRGVSQGLDTEKLALSLILSVDQGAGTKPINTLVQEGIDFLTTRRPEKEAEAELREAAYNNLIAKGVPKEIGEEIYYLASTEGWSAEVIKAVYDGLIRGQSLGLTPERVATAMIVRLAQGLGNVSPQRMVEQELAYVQTLEKERVKLIKEDRKAYKREPTPVQRRQLSYVQPRKPVAKKPTKSTERTPYVYYPVTQRSKLNVPLMMQSIREFLGPPPTPYRWGGTSRRGVDCSGFTRAVYLDQGILLPRVSRQQATVGTPVTSELQFGDLVFFRKYGWGPINHVGIYIGNGNFVHASCSRGVTIDSLNKNYYRTRFAGARRVLGG